MCGLAGYLGAADLPGAEAAHRVGLMTQALAHRGPDADGVWVEGPIALDIGACRSST